MKELIKGYVVIAAGGFAAGFAVGVIIFAYAYINQL